METVTEKEIEKLDIQSGGTFDSNELRHTLIMSRKTGTILNRGPSEIFGTWDNEDGPKELNYSAESGKFTLLSGESCRIPGGTRTITHLTGYGPAILMIVCD